MLWCKVSITEARNLNGPRRLKEFFDWLPTNTAYHPAPSLIEVLEEIGWEIGSRFPRIRLDHEFFRSQILDVSGDSVSLQELRSWERITSGSSTLSTDAKELAVLDRLTQLSGRRLEDIHGFDPSKADRLRMEFETDKSGVFKAWQTADLIANKWDIGRYDLHFHSDLYNDLRELGSAKTGLQADKWNPADCLLIDKSLDLPPQTIFGMFDELVEVNQIVPISLKDSSIAPTGSWTIPLRDAKLDRSRSLEDLRKLLSRATAVSSKIQIAVAERGSFYKTDAVSVEELFADVEYTRELRNPKNASWWWLFNVLDWMLSFGDSDGLDINLEQAISIASGVQSSKYWLCNPDYLKMSLNYKEVEIEVSKIWVVLNTKQLIIEQIWKTHKEYVKKVAQIRSKGASPVLNTYAVNRMPVYRTLTMD